MDQHAIFTPPPYTEYFAIMQYSILKEILTVSTENYSFKVSFIKAQLDVVTVPPKFLGPNKACVYKTKMDQDPQLSIDSFDVQIQIRWKFLLLT